jgi:tetratricopeptide (TPR) repeat protein
MKKSTYLVLGLTVALNANSGQAASTGVKPSANASLYLSALTPQGGNSIYGHVFSESRQPLGDVYLELQNEIYTTVARAKTNGSGFYSFPNISQGTFKVKVLPYGTNYGEQEKEVIIQPVSVVAGGGSDRQQIDFYLKVRPNANAGPLAIPNGTIFVQEVPEEAKKMYEKGVILLGEKKDKEGFESLKRSLEIFPNYYLALDRLGTEYVTRGYSEAAMILLMKAVEVNPRSVSSLLGLGIAQYNLKQNDAAIQTLQRATNLYNKSFYAYFYLALALKRSAKLDQSEAALKQANELSKGRDAGVHWQMALLYNDQHRFKEAAAELELFLKYQPKARDEEKIKQLIAQLREKATEGQKNNKQ